MFEVGQRVVCVETEEMLCRLGASKKSRGPVPFKVGDKFNIKASYPAGTTVAFPGGVGVVNGDSVAIGICCETLGMDAWPAYFFAPIEGLDISESLAALKGLFDRQPETVDA